MCLKVTYSGGTEDLFKAKKSKKSETVLTGKLPSNGMKVVILLADKDDPEDTVYQVLLQLKTYLSFWYICTGVNTKVYNPFQFYFFFRLYSKAIKLAVALDLALILITMVVLLV